MYPLWIFRFLLLFAPSVLVLIKFFGLHGRVDLGSWAALGYWLLLGLLSAVTVLIVLAYVSVANVPASYSVLRDSSSDETKP